MPSETQQSGKLDATLSQVRVGVGELEDQSDVEALMERAIVKCPVVKVKVSGQSINGLLDIGAEL